ncbi:MAG: TRAP transporter small permease [Clostridiales bacterium]|nr:TRAP transporter small permease [Clostridiales bacterium]
MKTVSKINRCLCRVEGVVMVVWFAVVLAVMACQVVSRYVFSAPLAWSEEFARYSFVWISYIGCAYCVGVDGHTSITALVDRLPVRGQRLLRLVGNVIMAGVFLRIMPIATSYIAKNGKFLTSIMRIPFKYLYWSLPVGIVLTLVHLALKSVLLFEQPQTESKA